MTWDVRDTGRMRRGTNDTGVASAPSRVGEDVGEEAVASGGPMLGEPPGGSLFSWGEETGEDMPWPQDVRREWQAQGFLTDQEWALMGRLMRRGIQEI